MLNIKVTKKLPERPKQFPLIMNSIQNPELVILFTEPEKGITLSTYNNCLYTVGEWCGGWDMNQFEPYNGTIELSNM